MIFAFALTIATGIGFGVIPALRVSRRDDASSLRETSRAGGGRRERLRAALVIAEVTGAVVLLVSCGLLIRAMGNVSRRDPGFRVENTLTLRTALPMPKYQERAPREQFYDKVLTEARRLPGVTGAAYSSFTPLLLHGGVWPVEVEGQPQEQWAQKTASMRFVTPGFFATLGIPLRMGRDLEESDTFTSRFVAVVSESFVQRYWPGGNALGRKITFGNYDRYIVGVVANVRVRGLEQNSEPQVYLPYKQEDRVSTWYAPKDLVLHSTGNPMTLVPALRRIVREADPIQPVSDVASLVDLLDKETGIRRLQVWVLGAFAAIAFLLAAIGIHGLLAFAVSNRTQEIGVRLALGASAGNILSMIMREGVVLALAGIAIGTVVAFGAGRALQALLAGVAPGDLETYAAAVGLCLVMTIAGSLAPALRAVRIDPTTAIRAE
ncbi:MAG TPA: FtsX-like permease family protein, partial [Bryobacteraceae bacterium]|nr:FtsX-like permease family protein [Bryobacteraceae bacterium]